MARELIRALFVPFAALAVFWGALAILGVVFTLSVGIAAHFGLLTSRSAWEQAGAILAGVSLAVAFLASLRIAQSLVRPTAGFDLSSQVKYIGLDSPDRHSSIVSALLLVLGFTVAVLAREFVGDTAFDETRTELSQKGERLAGLVHFLHFALIAPIVEEIVFRGYLQRRLSELCGRIPAYATVAVYFVAVHFLFISPTPTRVMTMGLFALMLGVMRLRNGPLLPAIALHVGFNLPMASAVLVHTQR